MKLRIALAWSLLTGFCGCQSPPSVGVPLTKATAVDGYSYSSAIVIVARTQGEGADSEVAWLKTTFPGFQMAGIEKKGEEEVVYFPHRTEANDDRIFSVWTIRLSDGTIRPVFFDITGYFGKH